MCPPEMALAAAVQTSRLPAACIPTPFLPRFLPHPHPSPSQIPPAPPPPSFPGPSCTPTPFPSQVPPQVLANSQAVLLATNAVPLPLPTHPSSSLRVLVTFCFLGWSLRQGQPQEQVPATSFSMSLGLVFLSARQGVGTSPSSSVTWLPPHVQRRRVRLREGKRLSLGHTARSTQTGFNRHP